VLHTEYPDFLPPAGGPGQCLIVWDRHRRAQGGETSPPPEDVQQLAAALEVPPASPDQVRIVEAPYVFDPGRVRRVYYVLLPEGAGRCR
jgi:hypothetical protein